MKGKNMDVLVFPGREMRQLGHKKVSMTKTFLMTKTCWSGRRMRLPG
jgi:hypothetical protein